MNEKRRKARQIAAKRLANESVAKLADLDLFGSVVGNVIQAIEQANLSNDLNSAKAALGKVTAEKDYLTRLLRDWQDAYKSLEKKFRRLEYDYVELKNRLIVYRDEIYKMQKLLEEKEAEIRKLKKGGESTQ